MVSLYLRYVPALQTKEILILCCSRTQGNAPHQIDLETLDEWLALKSAVACLDV